MSLANNAPSLDSSQFCIAATIGNRLLCAVRWKGCTKPTAFTLRLETHQAQGNVVLRRQNCQHPESPRLLLAAPTSQSPQLHPALIVESFLREPMRKVVNFSGSICRRISSSRKQAIGHRKQQHLLRLPTLRQTN